MTVPGEEGGREGLIRFPFQGFRESARRTPHASGEKGDRGLVRSGEKRYRLDTTT